MLLLPVMRVRATDVVKIFLYAFFHAASSEGMRMCIVLSDHRPTCCAEDPLAFVTRVPFNEGMCSAGT